ncbi:hypothetical protein KGI01_04060 [Kurthia gibsonii]|nr:hypothetical protein KGI01_04060 [Kurthia gibsonii]
MLKKAFFLEIVREINYLRKYEFLKYSYSLKIDKKTQITLKNQYFNELVYELFLIHTTLV